MGEVHLQNRTPGLQLWPAELRAGERLRIAFVPAFAGDDRDHHEVIVTNGRQPVATVARGRLRRSSGVICVEWAGTDDQGRAVPPGTYRVVVTRDRGSFRLERTLVVGT